MNKRSGRCHKCGSSDSQEIHGRSCACADFRNDSSACEQCTYYKRCYNNKLCWACGEEYQQCTYCRADLRKDIYVDYKRL